MRRLLQQFGCLDHHAALAETTQRRLLFNPRLLDRVKSLFCVRHRQILLLRPPCRQAFERGHFLAYSRGGRRNAGPNLFSVQQDRAGATLRQAATKLGACHFEFVSKDVKQGRICRSVNLTFPAVDGERDHLLQPIPNAGRVLSQSC